MAVCPKDALLHGCRLLWAMAQVTNSAHAQGWPAALGQPTLKDAWLVKSLLGGSKMGNFYGFYGLQGLDHGNIGVWICFRCCF